MDDTPRLRRLACFLIAAVVVFFQQQPIAMIAGGLKVSGAIELETQSTYSRIRVRKRGAVRQLTFVRDSGGEVIESMMNTRKPHDLLVPYTQFMFASYLFNTRHEQVLIVGLGGGSMVQFLRHHDPQVLVDAVEIDPVIVRIAETHFNTRSGGNVNILTADGFDYLADTEKRYDVIYMDAFLKPSSETDATGQPLNLKTAEFYETLQEKLTADGMVVFNLNPHAGLQEDITAIREAFPQVYLFRVANDNFIAVATLSDAREELVALRARARNADRRFRANFSFQKMLGSLVP